MSNIQELRNQCFIYFIFLFVWGKRENSILAQSGRASMLFNSGLSPFSRYENSGLMRVDNLIITTPPGKGYGQDLESDYHLSP